MRTDFLRSQSTLMWVLPAAALAATFSLPAGAHAHLDRALPIVGSVIRVPPPELKLWFTQRVEPTFSKVRILDRAGKPIASGPPQFDAGNGKALRVSLPKLAPGTYRVKWRVLSIDTHVSEGEFTFDVAQ